ncbi:MAG: STAS domain-containing protein [Azoarcus sp.]|jgi:phospholipid transport system transporter-binding protein|nr:STAS domain-containing protein [Azoarcus sp.]
MVQPSVVRLDGDLTLDTVAAWLGRDLPEGSLAFDFSAVARVDSSALALLLAWLRRAKAGGCAVELREMPPPLLALARLYGVDALLPLAA